MELSIKDIVSLTPPEAERLRGLALGGDVSAARQYVLFSAWCKIKCDRYIPQNKKVRAFRTLAENVQIDVEFVHG